MNIQGKIEAITEAETGTTKDGTEWAKRTIVVTDGIGDYPNRLVMNLFKKGEYLKFATTDFNYAVGDNVTIEYSTRANEYKDKWYGDNSIFKIEKSGAINESPKVDEESSPLPF